MTHEEPRRAACGPLSGVRVVVTRAAHQAGGLALAFAEAGARVEMLPLLEVVPPADAGPLERAAAEAAAYDWIVFTSANAVDALLPRLPSPAAGALAGGPRIAAVGGATAAALRRYGVEPSLVPLRRDAEGLIAELAGTPGRAPAPPAGETVPGGAAGGPPDRPPADASADPPAVATLRPRFLLPQAADARPTLARGLAAAGAEVAAVVAYDKRLPAEAPARARRLFGDADRLGWVTFTSPRVVAHFAELFGDGWPARRATLFAASIGPLTSRALAAAGVEPAAEAASPGDAELVAAVVAAAAAGVPRRPG